MPLTGTATNFGLIITISLLRTVKDGLTGMISCFVFAIFLAFAARLLSPIYPTNYFIWYSIGILALLTDLAIYVCVLRYSPVFFGGFLIGMIMASVPIFHTLSVWPQRLAITARPLLGLRISNCLECRRVCCGSISSCLPFLAYSPLLYWPLVIEGFHLKCKWQ